MATRVLIYEDNEALRNSMMSMLQWNEEYVVVAAMPNAETVENDIDLFKPEVVLMDIDMPGVNGVMAVSAIRKNNDSLPVIMFTVFDDDENIFNAICAGANGYLLKKNFEQIPAAIRDVMNGGAPMTSSVAKKVLGFIPKNKVENKSGTDGLSIREKEILEFIVKGYSYKMVADELSISIETVRSHIKKIYKKLQVNSATEAIYKYNQKK